MYGARCEWGLLISRLRRLTVALILAAAPVGVGYGKPRLSQSGEPVSFARPSELLVPAPANGAAALAGGEDDSDVTPAHPGQPYAVPVRELPSGSGPVAETLYRAFEIIVAAVGLILALPIMAVGAALVRCNSPGPPLFLHRRPGRSQRVRGRDLAHRARLARAAGRVRPGRSVFCAALFHDGEAAHDA